MKKPAQQKAIDNRANQLNPNNPAYYKSRMGNDYKKHTPQNNKSYKYNNQKTVVVHHHNHSAPKTVNGQSRPCPLCGGKGNLYATGKHRFGQAQLCCRFCNGTFFVDC